VTERSEGTGKHSTLVASPTKSPRGMGVGSGSGVQVVPRKAEEGVSLGLAVDRRQRGEAPPGRREPGSPFRAGSKEGP
jgi:hypothetical protein